MSIPIIVVEPGTAELPPTTMPTVMSSMMLATLARVINLLPITPIAGSVLSPLVRTVPAAAAAASVTPWMVTGMLFARAK